MGLISWLQLMLKCFLFLTPMLINIDQNVPLVKHVELMWTLNPLNVFLLKLVNSALIFMFIPIAEVVLDFQKVKLT